MWTRDEVARLYAGRVESSEFCRRRRERMQERDARARLYRIDGTNVSNVVPLRRGVRPLLLPPDEAA